MYDGKCRNKGLEKSENTVLRLKTPIDGVVRCNDLVRGEVVFNNSELDDLILLRSNGTPSYHLCVVVDDADQGVTTVIRGEDHLSNTPRQIHIQQALELPTLEYAHLPLVLGENKKRLSKSVSKLSFKSNMKIIAWKFSFDDNSKIEYKRNIAEYIFKRFFSEKIILRVNKVKIFDPKEYESYNDLHYKIKKFYLKD